MATPGPRQPDSTATADVAAVIVTFNPEVELLRSNIQSIATQVGRLYVFDNSSDNVDAIEPLVESLGAHLIASQKNVGIAAALNAAAARARQDGATYLVTLDQDSVPATGMVAELRRLVSDSTPLVAPFVVDRKKLSMQEFQELDLPQSQRFLNAASKGAITSGSIIDIGALAEVGGFDERLFIDYVDYDLNMRLMKSGYEIRRANWTYISHQVGEAAPTWLRTPRKGIDGRWSVEPFFSFGHSSFRCYYKARNRIIYSRKHWRQVGLKNEGIMQIPQQIILTLLFEEQRMSKLRAFSRGIWHGFREARRYKEISYLDESRVDRP